MQKLLDDILKKKQSSIDPKMPNNATDAVGAVGAMIMAKRYRKSRGVLHSAVADSAQMDFACKEDALCDEEHIYFLNQREFLGALIDKWSIKTSDLKVHTDDDRIRAVGIMFLEEMRPFIRYMLAEKDPHDCMELDE